MSDQILDGLCATAHAAYNEKVVNSLSILVFLHVLLELEVVAVVGEAIVTEIGLVVHRVHASPFVVIEDAGFVEHLVVIFLI